MRFAGLQGIQYQHVGPFAWRLRFSVSGLRLQGLSLLAAIRTSHGMVYEELLDSIPLFPIQFQQLTNLNVVSSLRSYQVQPCLKSGGTLRIENSQEARPYRPYNSP